MTMLFTQTYANVQVLDLYKSINKNKIKGEKEMKLKMIDALVTKVNPDQIYKADNGKEYKYSTITILHDGRTTDITTEKTFDVNQVEENKKYNFECTYNYRKVRIAAIA
jgi:azurin